MNVICAIRVPNDFYSQCIYRDIALKSYVCCK